MLGAAARERSTQADYLKRDDGAHATKHLVANEVEANADAA